MDKFELYTLHSRKITSSVGIYNMVHVFPHVRSFTCWEPQFDIADLRYFTSLKNLTLLRIPFTGTRAIHRLKKRMNKVYGRAFLDVGIRMSTT